MITDTMYKKLKKLTLKNIGRSYMLVESNGEDVNMTNVYSMNDTAAWLWKHIDTSDGNIEEIAAAMCEEYDVDSATAMADITQQFSQWREMKLIE